MVCWVSLFRCWQWGTAGVTYVRRGPGMSHVRIGWSQPAPMDPQKDIAEPINNDGGIYVIRYLRKGKKLHSQWGKKKKKIMSEKNHYNHQDQKGRRRCSRSQIPVCAPWYRYCPAAHGQSHTGAGGYTLKEAATCGKTTLEKRKIVRNKEWQRQTIMNWPYSTIPQPPALLSEVENVEMLGMKKWSWDWEKEDRTALLYF